MKMPPRAHLLVSLPPERYRVLPSRGRAPKLGDVVQLEQGYTGEDGKPMVLAYGLASDGDWLYSAEIYESEIGPDI
jgi:hypothetical protein